MGRSLLWADHYLIPDRLAELALMSDFSRAAWEAALLSMLTLRPLIESGLAVPVASSDPTIATAAAVVKELEADMMNRRFMD